MTNLSSSSSITVLSANSTGRGQKKRDFASEQSSNLALNVIIVPNSSYI